MLRGFRAEIEPAALGLRLQAMVSVKLERHSRELFEHVRERLVDVAPVLGGLGPEVVADLVPDRAIEVASLSQIVGMLGDDGGTKTRLAPRDDCGVPKDVLANQNRPTVASRDVRFVRQDRRGVAAARLAEVRVNAVDADGHL